MQPILVTYASQYGSTAEIAQAIADRLRQRGEQVDVYPVQDVSDVSGYGAVVIGSAVRIGRWLPAAIKFVEQHREALQRVPTALFTVHLMALDNSARSQQQREAYLAPVRGLLAPQAEAFFPGRVDLHRLSFGERLIASLVRSPVGDLRDWGAIQAWADHLFEQEGATI